MFSASAWQEDVEHTEAEKKWPFRIRAWIRKYIHVKQWDVITSYALTSMTVKLSDVEVMARINNSILRKVIEHCPC